jgi:hypothetical protein
VIAITFACVMNLCSDNFFSLISKIMMIEWIVKCCE